MPLFEYFLGNPEILPGTVRNPTFDSQLGFPNGRKEKVMIATQDELDAAKVPDFFRDYCAHYWLDYMACTRMHYPFYHRCHVELHKHGHCEANEYVMRMKEYERERRLRLRQKRIEEKKAKELLANA